MVTFRYPSRHVLCRVCYNKDIFEILGQNHNQFNFYKAENPAIWSILAKIKEVGHAKLWRHKMVTNSDKSVDQIFIQKQNVSTKSW